MTRFHSPCPVLALAFLLFASPAFAAPFTDNLDGTVTDDATGLIWDKCSWGQTWDSIGNTCSASGDATTHDWADALALAITANDTSHRSYDDWRLPNRTELESLVDLSTSNPAIDGTAFPNTPSNWYWTSTTYAPGPANAWFVDFGDGAAYAGVKPDAIRVRLVRSGQSFDALAGVATQIAIQAGDGQTATAGTAVAIPPSVIVLDANDNPVADVAVSFAVASGGGSVTGEAATTNAGGIATVGSWTLGATAGSNTLTATANGLTGSSVTFTATGTAGVATQIAIQAGDGQTATAGTAVAIPPSVIVLDANDNPVADVAVTFAVASGGGSVTGEAATTNAGGIATVGSWTLGATVGSNALTASAPGLTGSPLTFTATGTTTPAVPIPTLRFWAVVLLTLLMLAMALPAVRRREGV